jgi:hypothetical protein
LPAILPALFANELANKRTSLQTPCHYITGEFIDWVADCGCALKTERAAPRASLGAVKK